MFDDLFAQRSEVSKKILMPIKPQLSPMTDGITVCKVAWIGSRVNWVENLINLNIFIKPFFYAE